MTSKFIIAGTASRKVYAFSDERLKLLQNAAVLTLQQCLDLLMYIAGTEPYRAVQCAIPATVMLFVNSQQDGPWFYSTWVYSIFAFTLLALHYLSTKWIPSPGCWIDVLWISIEGEFSESALYSHPYLSYWCEFHLLSPITQKDAL